MLCVRPCVHPLYSASNTCPTLHPTSPQKKKKKSKPATKRAKATPPGDAGPAGAVLAGLTFVVSVLF